MEHPLPDLGDAVVETNIVNQLFADIGACTKVDQVRVRGQAFTHVVPHNIPLADAAAMLLGGQVSGVQILYRWEGSVWCDTVMRVEPGRFRVVRIQSGS